MCVCSFAQLSPTLCDPMDSSLHAPLSLESLRQEYWSVLPFSSQGSSQPRQQTQVSHTAGRFFKNCVHGLWPEWKPFVSLTRRMDAKRQRLYIIESRGRGIYPGLYYLDLNHVCMWAKLLQLCLTLGTLWTLAHQAPLSMGFSRQEHLVVCHALL